jgi:hypothetical protein
MCRFKKNFPFRCPTLYNIFYNWIRHTRASVMGKSPNFIHWSSGATQTHINSKKNEEHLTSVGVLDNVHYCIQACTEHDTLQTLYLQCTTFWTFYTYNWHYTVPHNEEKLTKSQVNMLYIIIDEITMYMAFQLIHPIHMNFCLLFLRPVLYYGPKLGE